MKWFLLLTLLVGFNAFAGDSSYSFSGKRYSISYELKDDVQEIRLDGTVFSSVVEDLTGFKKVQKLLRKGVDVKLILYSHGGLQSLYNDLSESIRNACNSRYSSCRVTTYVSSASTCESACIPLFMVGDLRKAGRQATFGFHQATVIPGSFKIYGKAQNDLYDAGVDKYWLDSHKNMFDSVQLTVMYPDDMDGSNIVTKIVD
jgi:hypothetical protein